MSEQDPTLPEQDPKPEPRAKKEKAKPQPPVKYITTGEHSYPFDVQISGEVIQGQWTRTEKKVEFLVPQHLVEGFELHFHFVSGNVVEAPAAE